MKKYFEIIVTVLLIISIALNTVILLSSNSNSSSALTVEEILQQEKNWDAYTKSIGEKYLQVIGDKVSTSEYNYKSVIGSVMNNSNKTIEEVQIKIILYKNNQIIRYDSGYITKIPANTKIDFEIYLSDLDFDAYVIDYVSGVILD